MPQKLLRDKAGLVENYLRQHFSESVAERIFFQQYGQAADVQLLQKSIRYSLLQGGKRFRPALAMMVSEALGYSAERVLPFSAAVECVHTYSLIHDDLPAMDNDDFRRGIPTNHRAFDEATAILAGDALLTEAFRMVAVGYTHEATIGLKLIEALSTAAGFYGMVGGQIVDIEAQKKGLAGSDLDQKQSVLRRLTRTDSDSTYSVEALVRLEMMHRLKTGALIKVAATGAATACFASEQQLTEISTYADKLGLAFQVADDLLDYNPQKLEPGSYPALIGVEQTKSHLHELTESALRAISTWGEKAEPLREIARYNKNRLM